MCLQAVPRDTPSSLQTLDRVKSYKVVGQVSSYARDLAEASTIYNYIAPMSQKGLAKVQSAAAPYVPDVSQYVPTNYVKKVDSLGVTCLDRFENVTTSSEEALQRQIKGVTKYVHKLLPVDDEAETESTEAEEKPEKVESLTLSGLQHRIYVNGKKRVQAIQSGVSQKFAPVTEKVNGAINGVQTKISPVKESVTGAITTVSTTLSPTNIVSSTKRSIETSVASLKSLRDELTYAKLSERAVASTSSAVSKVPGALQSTKNATLAYIPESYRSGVEDKVAVYEAGVVNLWQRMPTTEELRNVKNIDRQQVKHALRVAANKTGSLALSPVYYLYSFVPASPFSRAPKASAVTVEAPEATVTMNAPESSEPIADCEDNAPAPEAN